MSNFLKEKTLWKVIFDISELFSAIQIATVSTWQVELIYIYMGVPVLECAVYLCVYDVKYSKWNGTSNVARSPIQSNKQDIKNSRGWRLEATDREVGQNFKKVGSQYRGVFITYGVLGTLCQLWPITSCSGKRMFW